MSAKESLLDILNSTARWREQVANRFPDDHRNLATAGALDALATYVRSLDGEDPRFRTLEELASVYPGEIQFASQGEASAYLSHLRQAVTPAPPKAVLDGLIRAAAVDVVVQVAEEVREATDAADGSPLQRIARIAQHKDRLETELGALLRDAADRGVSWTVLADLSGLTRQTLASRYGASETEPSPRPQSRPTSTQVNPNCANCNHPRSFHKDSRCHVGLCGCPGFHSTDDTSTNGA
jgi:hypothetical protein